MLLYKLNSAYEYDLHMKDVGWGANPKSLATETGLRVFPKKFKLDCIGRICTCHYRAFSGINQLFNFILFNSILLNYIVLCLQQEKQLLKNAGYSKKWFLKLLIKYELIKIGNWSNKNQRQTIFCICISIHSYDLWLVELIIANLWLHILMRCFQWQHTCVLRNTQYIKYRQPVIYEYRHYRCLSNSVHDWESLTYILI